MAVLGGSIARRYAKAIFAIAVEQGNFELLGRQLGELAALWKDSLDLRQTLENPVFKLSHKRAVLQGLMPRLAPARQVQSLALLLLERGRIAALPAVARAYEEMCDAKLGRARALVKSAKPLDIASETEIRKALERRTGKKVIMTTVVEPGLIGGVVAHVAGMVLDGSLASRLDALRHKLLN
ncbi:MAG: ATP synthase F1 subunit delta [Deltaproteobacteria bacterium]|nr:ATP synthase F1 subunit delta [Deltaproteobacteria bacterium]